MKHYQLLPTERGPSLRCVYQNNVFFPVVRAVGTPGTTSGIEVRIKRVTVMEREAEKCGDVSKVFGLGGPDCSVKTTDTEDS